MEALKQRSDAKFCCRRFNRTRREANPPPYCGQTPNANSLKKAQRAVGRIGKCYGETLLATCLDRSAIIVDQI
jgi:hypothetical protein